MKQQTVCDENKRIIIREETAELEGYHLTYVLCELLLDGENEEEYSITVTIEKDSYRDTMTAHDVTINRKRAVEIFELIWRNRVTPCTLLEILSDVL